MMVGGGALGGKAGLQQHITHSNDGTVYHIRLATGEASMRVSGRKKHP